MDYFNTFNLQKEPFSNSPDPEFFFESRVHKGCLQKLELSIRLRRGLNVVLGEVGTGKTTLCRHLIRNLAEDDKIENHLVLDPAFPDPLAFLRCLASLFGLPASPCGEESEWRLKNEIQKHLFQEAFEKGKILVLIVDEGQKISDSSLEILRELLNYEANDSKLLQIVIFAQTEFEQTLLSHSSFSDRVSFYTKLGPLPFRETRSMIRFRLHKASQGHPAPALFTSLGYLAIHRATGGYPRKIIHLCHRILLAMIIRSQTQAGWSLVRWSARMSFTSRVPRKMLPLGLVSTLVVLGLTVFLSEKYIPQQWGGSAVERKHQPAGVVDSNGFSSVPSVPVEKSDTSPMEASPEGLQSGSPVIHAGPLSNPGLELSRTPETSPQLKRGDDVPATTPPKLLGQIVIAEGETLEEMIRNVYGTSTPNHLKALKRSNPHIREVRTVETGTAIRFPALKPMHRQAAQGYWLSLAIKGTLADSYELLRGLRTDKTIQRMRGSIRALLPQTRDDEAPAKHPMQSNPLIMVPFWNRSDGLKFAILFNAVFPDSQSAVRAMGKLPHDRGGEASVLGQWGDDTLFFTEALPIDKHR